MTTTKGLLYVSKRDEFGCALKMMDEATHVWESLRGNEKAGA